jgi:multisubunit Na+/H+ antiporter MnhG subunit
MGLELELMCRSVIVVAASIIMLICRYGVPRFKDIHTEMLTSGDANSTLHS